MSGRRRPVSGRGRSRGRGRQQQSRQPSMFWGRALITVVILFTIWAWAKGQHA